MTIKSSSLWLEDSPFGTRCQQVIEEIVGLEQIDSGIKTTINHSTYKEVKVEMKLVKQADAELARAVVLALPLMTNEIPVDFTVVKDETLTPVSIADLIREWASSRLEYHDGSVEQCFEEFGALSALP